MQILLRLQATSGKGHCAVHEEYGSKDRRHRANVGEVKVTNEDLEAALPPCPRLKPTSREGHLKFGYVQFLVRVALITKDEI